MSFLVVPCTSVRAGRISIYNKYEGFKSRRKSRWVQLLQGYDAYKDAINKEELSRKAAARLRDKIMLLVDASKPKKVYNDKYKSYFSFKVSFVTLTLPSSQCHSDKEIHTKIFKEFVRAWKRKNKDLLYVWKAETQANGSLHYHMVTNSYIHHIQLRRMWNYYCEKLGYCSRSKSSNPNSTDVHSIRKVNNIAAYVIKYMSKKSDGRRVPTIRKWDCSLALSIPHPVYEGAGTDINEAYQQMIIQNTRVWYSDFCTCLFPTQSQLAQAPLFAVLYSDYIAKIREYNRQQIE